MKVINFAETNSVLNQYVAEIRDVAVQGDRMRFRRNIERIGEIMAYEMSKELTYSRLSGHNIFSYLYLFDITVSRLFFDSYGFLGFFHRQTDLFLLF